MMACRLMKIHSLMGMNLQRMWLRAREAPGDHSQLPYRAKGARDARKGARDRVALARESVPLPKASARVAVAGGGSRPGRNKFRANWTASTKTKTTMTSVLLQRKLTLLLLTLRPWMVCLRWLGQTQAAAVTGGAVMTMVGGNTRNPQDQPHPRPSKNLIRVRVAAQNTVGEAAGTRNLRLARMGKCCVWHVRRGGAATKTKIVRELVIHGVSA